VRLRGVHRFTMNWGHLLPNMHNSSLTESTMNWGHLLPNLHLNLTRRYMPNCRSISTQPHRWDWVTHSFPFIMFERFGNRWNSAMQWLFCWPILQNKDEATMQTEVG
jgi:hypothetical protein